MRIALILLLGACTKGGDETAIHDSVSPDSGDTSQEPTSELVAAPEPAAPDFPATIDHLSVTVRTGPKAFDDTDDNTLSLCLTASDCFSLDTPDVNDFRLGEFDTFWFEGAGVARSAVDRVEIRSVSGADRWTMECLDVRFDGEPVYCRDGLELQFGEENDELQSWTDTLGNQCTSCTGSVLPWGPMVGAPDRGRIWLRTDATRKVGVRMAHTEGAAATGPVVAWAYPEPSRGHAAELQVEGLLPDTDYFYVVEVDEVAVTQPERLSTPPLPGEAAQWLFAFGSCSKDESQPIFGAIDQLRPDLFLYIGDNHYGNTAYLSAHRWNYGYHRSRAARRRMAAHTPSVATWDDHDFVGNNTLGSAPGKDVALRAFREHWANPSYGTSSTEGVFGKVTWGDVDLFLLDDRYYRGLDDSVLGDEQTAWLKTELAASTATFKMLASGSQFTLQGSSDSWRVWPAAQREFLGWIDDNDIQGVLLISGDIHRSELRALPNGDGYDLPEITSSPLATWNSACGADAELRACFDDGDSVVTMAFDTTLADPTVTARILDEDGTTRAEWVIKRSELQ